MTKLSFSGHESFHCRSLWLKKGYDFLYNKNEFKKPSAVVDLGVGKNMVSSINFWMKSFGLIGKDDNLSKIADFIFGKDGVDPYLENPASLWLLHFHIVSENKASIYSLVFNEFRKKKPEFNKRQLLNFLKAKCQNTNTNFNENSILRDISVFVRNYVKPSKANRNLEELFSGLFIELNLIEPLMKFDEKETDWYQIINKERESLPAEILLYGILANKEYDSSISLEELLYGFNSIGNIFALSGKDILEKIETITKNNKTISFSDVAGIRELQFNKIPDRWNILRKYYGQ